MDKREAILARLLTIATAVPGITTAARNALNLSQIKLPSIVIFDGDEEAQAAPSATRSASAPVLVSMSPEIVIAVADTKAQVGTVLNGFRSALVKAILTDATLAGLVAANGGISYLGCSSGLARSSDMAGELGVNMTFLYVLTPSQL
ncbi:MAG: hypothetical protein V4747_11465 [Pseudomonadota bacterium]